MYIHASLNFYTLHNAFDIFVNIITGKRAILLRVLHNALCVQKKMGKILSARNIRVVQRLITME